MRNWTRHGTVALFVLAGMLLLGSDLAAQSTGFPGLQDLTINGRGSGGESCIAVDIPTGSALTLKITTEAKAPVYLLLSPNPCVISKLFFNNCLRINGRDEQTLDVPFTNILYLGRADANGELTRTLPTCPPGLFFSVQALVIHSGCGFGQDLLVSQAFDVTCL